MVDEVNNDIAKQTSVNKKTLTLALVRKVLENEKAKQEIVALFDEPAALDEEIKQFLNKVNLLLPKFFDEKKKVPTKDNLYQLQIFLYALMSLPHTYI